MGVKRSFIVSLAVYTAFQQCSGDYNPLHTDEEFARGKGFPERVMYGNILNAFVSMLIGESLCKNLRRYIELSFIFRIFMERN